VGVVVGLDSLRLGVVAREYQQPSARTASQGEVMMVSQAADTRNRQGLKGPWAEPPLPPQRGGGTAAGGAAPAPWGGGVPGGGTELDWGAAGVPGT
jgi:hypothetical protein